MRAPAAGPHPARPERPPERDTTSFVHLPEREGTTLAEDDERALIAKLRARDLGALAELHGRLGSAMSTLAAGMLRNRTEAEDVVEEALLKIHDAAPGFRGERGLKTWTLRIVANLCRDRLRRRRFQANLRPEEMPEASHGLSVDPQLQWDETMDRGVLLEALERALATLPPEQREIVLMRHRLGLSQAEIAEALHLPEGTVKSRVSRALAALRTAMKEPMR